jgi:hypothetical protein
MADPECQTVGFQMTERHRRATKMFFWVVREIAFTPHITLCHLISDTENFALFEPARKANLPTDSKIVRARLARIPIPEASMNPAKVYVAT